MGLRPCEAQCVSVAVIYSVFLMENTFLFFLTKVIQVYGKSQALQKRMFIFLN